MAWRDWTKNAFQQFVESDCKNLIIDVRGNGGGSDGVWRDYNAELYDHPSKPYICWFRNTPENLYSWERMLDIYSTTKNVQKFMKECKSSKKNFEKWVERDGDMGLQSTTSIHRAAVLVDWMTASASESLVCRIR